MKERGNRGKGDEEGRGEGKEMAKR